MRRLTVPTAPSPWNAGARFSVGVQRSALAKRDREACGVSSATAAYPGRWLAQRCSRSRRFDLDWPMASCPAGGRSSPTSAPYSGALPGRGYHHQATLRQHRRSLHANLLAQVLSASSCPLRPVRFILSARYEHYSCSPPSAAIPLPSTTLQTRSAARSSWTATPPLGQRISSLWTWLHFPRPNDIHMLLLDR